MSDYGGSRVKRDDIQSNHFLKLSPLLLYSLTRFFFVFVLVDIGTDV